MIFIIIMKTILQEELNRLRQLMLSEEMVQSDGYKKLKQTIDILKKKDKVLLLSCSNRYQFDSKNIDIPKSKLLAFKNLSKPSPGGFGIFTSKWDVNAGWSKFVLMFPTVLTLGIYKYF